MNECSYCGEPVAMMSASECGPQEDGLECPCCGLSLYAEETNEELAEGE